MKKWVLWISICLLIAVSLFCLFGVERSGIRYELGTEKKIEKIKTESKSNEELNLELTFNESALPYDSTSHTFFLPLSMEETWETGSIEGMANDSPAVVLFEEDFGRESKLTLMAEDHAIPFLAYAESGYQTYYLKITGVSVISFAGTEYTSAGGLPVFSLDVYDASTKKDWVTSCYTTSALHGNTSLAYEKKSLRLKLLSEKDGSFSKQNENLLGLREDDDWILNSLYADSSRIRDKLAIDLWQETGAGDNPYHRSFGTDAEYVEVFVNDNYQGLYLLMYPIDAKQLGMEKTSTQLEAGETVVERLYKKKYTALWNEADFTGELPDPNMPDYRGGFYVKGDTVLSDLTEWEPLRMLAACISSEDSAFAEEITALVDQKSTVDNWLFYQAIGGFDNLNKNVYYAARKEGGAYKGYFIPWDLNISFGVVYAENPYYCATDTSTVNQVIAWQPGQRMIEGNVAQSAVLADTTWQSWREGVFSDAALLERIEALEGYVKESGAFTREQNRWPDGNADADFSVLKKYATDRLGFVDEYIEQLQPTE